ncbi:EamA family transporter [Streptomyces sp. NRRL B-24085]|uniref:EamA family transporter n=1 Tax=Streptomyces sp. NRRL B-24085 TaxID=1709476 RepID=UPI0006B32B6C|nr:EamA family transporter [Streptomyces sp. NRRL B-24085]
MNSGRQLLSSGVTALAPAIWGSTYLVTTEWLPPERPMLATTVRALPSGLILLLISRTLPNVRWLWRSLVLGTLNIGAFNVLLFVAAYRLPGGIAAMIMAVQPVIVLILAALVLGDRPRAAHVMACALGAAGVVLLVFKGPAALDPAGVAAALGGAACMATGITFTKRWGRPEGVGLIPFTGWQLTAGGLVALPFTLSIEGLPTSLTGTNLFGFAYLTSLGAVISYALWFRGIEKLPALAVSFLALGSPIVATVLGITFEHERLAALQVVGTVLILLAVVLAQPRQAPPRTTTAERLPAREDSAVHEPKAAVGRSGGAGS